MTLIERLELEVVHPDCVLYPGFPHITKERRTDHQLAIDDDTVRVLGRSLRSYGVRLVVAVEQTWKGLQAIEVCNR